MPQSDQQARLEEAFERIEETILPCIAMMLETLIDASESVAEGERRFLVGELKTLAAELEELTRAVERSSPVHVEPGEYKTRERRRPSLPDDPRVERRVDIASRQHHHRSSAGVDLAGEQRREADCSARLDHQAVLLARRSGSRPPPLRR